MSETSTLIAYGGRTIDRDELVLVPTMPDMKEAGVKSGYAALLLPQK